jgi:hypothetical protein
MSKAITSAIKGVPVIHIVEFAGMFFNHLATMSQIEKEYKLKSKELDHNYDIAMKRLEADIVSFTKTIEYCEHLSIKNHEKQMKILDFIDRHLNRCLEIKDPTLLEYHYTMTDKLLDTFTQIMEQQSAISNINLLGRGV